MNRQRKRGDRMNTELYELLTSAQLQQRETAEGGRALLPSRFCRAEPVKGGVRGTFAVPQKADPAGPRRQFAFRLTQMRLLLADDSNFLRSELGKLEGKLLQEPQTPAQLLAELTAHLLQNDAVALQRYEDRLSEMEEELLRERADGFEQRIFQIRRELSAYAAYYEQLTELCGTLSEETEDDPRAAHLFDALSGRAQRLAALVQMHREYSLQLREMHQTQIDVRQNNIMKILTIVTTVFLPLSLIAGWYGMNFVNMPELQSANGYRIVCIASALCVVLELLIFKWKSGSDSPLLRVVAQILKPFPRLIRRQEAADGHHRHEQPQRHHPPDKRARVAQKRENPIGQQHQNDADGHQQHQNVAVAAGFDLFHGQAPRFVFFTIIPPIRA